MEHDLHLSCLSHISPSQDNYELSIITKGQRSNLHDYM